MAKKKKNINQTPINFPKDREALIQKACEAEDGNISAGHPDLLHKICYGNNEAKGGDIKKRIIITLGADGSVLVQKSVPGISVEVRDYGVPDDWGNNPENFENSDMQIDEDGDPYQRFTFNDKGKMIEGGDKHEEAESFDPVDEEENPTNDID